MNIVHQLCFWLVQRSILVKEKVGGLKRDLILNIVKIDIYKRFGKSLIYII